METTDLALACRDWMVYREQHFLYKCTVSKALNSWTDSRKNDLKPHFKHLNRKTTNNAWEEIVVIYESFLNPLMEPITTEDGTYTDWQVLATSKVCTVYKALLDEKNVIVKVYTNVERNAYAATEDEVSMALYKKGLMVPKRYESFNTTHYLCIPMQKLETTLLEMYKLDPVGIGLHSVKMLVRHFVPILEVIHKEFKRCYVDFSCGNVAFQDNVPYMIDFGALHYTFCGKPFMKTLRYQSINCENEQPVTFLDDFQSLGFVITEALYGPSVDLTKQSVIDRALSGKLGVFLQSYFKAIDSEDPYTTILSLC